MDAYLSNREIQYIGNDGRHYSRVMEAGVPQGSILGPILWNIAFDDVLRLANEEDGCYIICYADDTLIIVTGLDIVHARLKAGVFATRVINYINNLGLAVATEKTEALLFRSRGAVDLPSSIMIGDTPIEFKDTMKYLGVMIDQNWSFSEHFRYIKQKAGRVTRALNRLMPNLKGPDERRHRLYANVVLSVMLYGAPVWGNAISRSRLLTALNSLERSVAQRVISAYRTVSSDAALLLARILPIKNLALMRMRVYERIKEHKDNRTYSIEVRNSIRDEETTRMQEEWSSQLERPNTPAEFTKLAIVPRFDTWLSRESGGITFHMTQMLTGHGCFGKFLFRIGKKMDASCDFCGEDVHDVYHTLRACPAWDPQRIRLKRSLGLARDFSIGDIVDSILDVENNWVAFSAFVENVMREKKDEERRRERARRDRPSSGEDGSD